MLGELKLLQTRLQELESDTAIPRASKVLAGLQFSEEMIRGPVSALSGIVYPLFSPLSVLRDACSVMLTKFVFLENYL